jgi:hypothetical protein
MPRTSFPAVTTRFRQILTSIQANIGDFPHVEPERLELGTLMDEITVLNAEQAALFAQSQQTTKDLNEKLDRAMVLFAQLRAAVRAKYGTRSEKLTEFHLRPLNRPRRPAAKKEEKNPAAPASLTAPTTPNPNT